MMKNGIHTEIGRSKKLQLKIKNMINWINADDDTPDNETHVAILLPNGRVCSGMITKTGRFELDYVDNLDLVVALTDTVKWVYLDK